MHNHLVPVLVLLVLPALYLGHRLGLLADPRVRWIGGGALLLAVALSLPFEGIDFVYLKRIKLLLAAAAALLLLLRHLKLPWALERSRYRRLLGALAVLSALVYLNFFAFHAVGGGRSFVHLHDVAHNYLGAKFFNDTATTEIYTAMLRAESERYEDRFKAIEARDLESYELVHIRTLLRESDPVRAAFSPQRWAEFQSDVAYFREALGRQYAGVLRDHGFNGSPVWALLGGPLAGLVAAGSDTGIFLLTLLDPLLLVGLLAAIGWAFGLEALLLSVLYLGVLFGAGFGWTGGGFLRMPWLFGLIGAVCCLRRRHYATAGALLAGASLLRIFPAFFALPLLARALALVLWRRPLPRRYVAFFGGFLLTAGILVALTGLLPRGWSHWADFRANLATHMEVTSPNLVGLTQVLAYRSAPTELAHEEFRALEARRQAIHRVQLWLVFLPLLALVARRAPRQHDLAACALALPLIFVAQNLAAYYCAFLLVLVLVHHRDAQRLTLLFAVEAASYSLMLFEDREGLLFVYRSILIGLLFAALYPWGPGLSLTCGRDPEQNG
jgi:hypothetical protein